MAHRLWVVALSLGALALPAARAHAQVLPAEDHMVELGVMFWKPSPDLVLSTVAGINEVDFVQEFGIEDKYFPEFRASIGRSHKLRVSFVTIKYDAETTIRRTIVFRGRMFRIGVPASTDITWNLWKFGYEMKGPYFGAVVRFWKRRTLTVFLPRSTGNFQTAC